MSGLTRVFGRLFTNVVVVVVVFALAWVHGRYIGDYAFFSSSRLPWTVAFSALLVGSSYAVGLPDEPAGGYRWAFASALIAATIATVGISLAQLLVGDALLPRFVVFWASLFALGWYWLSAAIADDVRRKHYSATRIAIVAEGAEIDRLQGELDRAHDSSAQICVAIAVDATDFASADLVARVSEAGAEVIVLDRSAQAIESVVAQVVTLHGRGVRVRTLSLFYEEWLQKLPVSELERISLLFDISELHRVTYARFKRLGDVVAGLLLVVVTALVTVPLFLLNFMVNRGPLFFRQTRVGRNGKAFTLYKFRSMRRGADIGSWTEANDPRVSAFGRFVRRTHIDELPQAWNIVRGDLSLIGPRPEQPHYVEQLSREISFYDVRHLVRPGLTGWAQVRHQYGSSVDDAQQKLQYDFYYLRRQGPALDARILAKTMRSTLLGRGQ